jgi:hypothetical protein
MGDEAAREVFERRRENFVRDKWYSTVLVGPLNYFRKVSVTKNRHEGGFLLFLHFLVDHMLAQCRIVLAEFDFSLNFFLVTSSRIDMIRLRTLELNKMFLWHIFVL